MRLFKTIANLFQPFIFRVYKYYSRRERSYTYQEIKIRVCPGIFHPGLFFSSEFLLEHLLAFDLKNSTLLEIGTGTGIIAIAAARKEANVTATDINKNALACAYLNSKNNQVNLTLIESDVFNSLPEFQYDFIITNPPYYPAEPSSEEEHAWFAGKDHQFFKNLFTGLKNYLHKNSKVLIVLSEDCRIDEITKLAEAHSFILNLSAERTGWLEKNFIYEIERKEPEKLL